jgi:hypothetical protein
VRYVWKIYTKDPRYLNMRSSRGLGRDGDKVCCSKLEVDKWKTAQSGHHM